MLVDGVIFEPGLRQRSASKKAVASAMVDDRDHCREAWVASGFSVEFAVKALIARRRGWDSWPSQQAHPELHTHTLRRLFTEAGIDLAAVPRPLLPSLKQIFDWERRHDYIAASMPRKVARSMFTAAFGDHGIVEWLNQQ